MIANYSLRISFFFSFCYVAKVIKIIKCKKQYRLKVISFHLFSCYLWQRRLKFELRLENQQHERRPNSATLLKEITFKTKLENLQG